MADNPDDLHEQFCRGGFEYYGPDEDADQVRLWDHDVCIAEFQPRPDQGGTWWLTGSDVDLMREPEEKSGGWRDARAALDYARRWMTRA
jgi:hypothetical protein